MPLSLDLTMVIYVITHVASGRQYVGQTVRKAFKRKQQHIWLASGSRAALKHETRITRAIRKHGFDQFTFEVIDQCESLTELDEHEARWIKELNTLSPNGFNLRAGAGSHGALSQEVCERISETLTGRVFTEEHRDNIRSARLGKRHSEETRLKISHNRKGKGTVSRPSKRKGIPISNEHREAISAALTGRQFSEESRARMSAAHLGQKRGPYSVEHRANISNALIKRTQMARQQSSSTIDG